MVIIFSKKLTKTDVQRRCAVGMEYFNMECFPKPTSRLQGKRQQEFFVKDESGRDWTLCCSTRNIGEDPNRPKHPKPVLIKEWIPFVRYKGLSEGDVVIIYQEQGETGLMQRRIEVQKRTSTAKARWSPIMNQNLAGNNGSTSHNSANESTATFQPFKDHSADVLNHDIGGTTATTTSSINKEQIPSPHSTFEDIASHKMKRPRLNLSLELTLGGTTAATRSQHRQANTNLPKHFSRYRNTQSKLEFGIDSDTTVRGGQQHDYIQDSEPKTIDFLGRFL